MVGNVRWTHPQRVFYALECVRMFQFWGNLKMIENQIKETPAYLAAKNMLPPELHPELAQLIQEYKFAALKVHKMPFVSPKVLAELILMGWRTQKT
jgi:hypothetical protein